MEARKIIITGGATRIGAAIAKKLSGPNKEILIHYNKSKFKAESLRKDLEKNGTKIYLVKGDLSKEVDVNKIVKYAKLPELEKWVLHRLSELDEVVRDGYDNYSFQAVFQQIFQFCTIDLSSLYFDIFFPLPFPNLFEFHLSIAILLVSFSEDSSRRLFHSIPI